MENFILCAVSLQSFFSKYIQILRYQNKESFAPWSFFFLTKLLQRRSFILRSCPEPQKVSLVQPDMGLKLKKQEGFSSVVYGELAITKSNDSIWLSNQQQKTTKFGKIVKHLLFTFPFLQNNHCQNCHIPKKATKGSMREKCQNTEFFLAYIFPHSD